MKMLILRCNIRDDDEVLKYLEPALSNNEL